ncbi:MAG TPA: hypothetical protein VIM90_08775, partial [Arenimonas sp.]
MTRLQALARFADLPGVPASAPWVAAICAALACLPVSAQEANESSLDLGGAVRFNLGWLGYADPPNEGELELELLRFDAKGQRGPLSFSLQYRWYDGFDAVHHAWAAYTPSPGSQWKLGIQQVPFGLLPYASHSFWFGSGYYLGLEDDHDPGLVYHLARGNQDLHVGLFTGDEYGDAARFDRYSFDVADDGVLRYREAGRVHLRWARRWAHDAGELEFGASGFTGRVQHQASRRHHGHHGAAAHLQYTRGDWTWQGQWAWYRYDVPGGRIALSAFLFPFEIASEGHVLSANAAWALPRSGWFDGITCYNNLSTTQGRGPGSGDSWQNVLGCSFAKGKSFTYVDLISGRNMWFIGGPGIALDAPGDPGWNTRLNINIGF